MNRYLRILFVSLYLMRLNESEFTATVLLLGFMLFGELLGYLVPCLMFIGLSFYESKLGI